MNYAQVLKQFPSEISTTALCFRRSLHSGENTNYSWPCMIFLCLILPICPSLVSGSFLIIPVLSNTQVKTWKELSLVLCSLCVRLAFWHSAPLILDNSTNSDTLTFTQGDWWALCGYALPTLSYWAHAELTSFVFLFAGITIFHSLLFNIQKLLFHIFYHLFCF